MLPRTPASLARTVADLIVERAPLRLIVDGIGSGQLADAVAEVADRPTVRVSGRDFLRPAGERFAAGREDARSFREDWLDAGALRREVLDAAPRGRYLPALWDADRDRSARAAVRPVPVGAVVIVDGLFLLGRGLTAELTVHIALSESALLRRGVPAWQLAAFRAYQQGRPDQRCDVLVRAEDPLRPAVRISVPTGR